MALLSPQTPQPTKYVLSRLKSARIPPALHRKLTPRTQVTHHVKLALTSDTLLTTHVRLPPPQGVCINCRPPPPNPSLEPAGTWEAGASPDSAGRQEQPGRRRAFSPHSPSRPRGPLPLQSPVGSHNVRETEGWHLPVFPLLAATPARQQVPSDAGDTRLLLAQPARPARLPHCPHSPESPRGTV